MGRSLSYSKELAQGLTESGSDAHHPPGHQAHHMYLWGRDPHIIIRCCPRGCAAPEPENQCGSHSGIFFPWRKTGGPSMEIKLAGHWAVLRGCEQGNYCSHLIQRWGKGPRGQAGSALLYARSRRPRLCAFCLQNTLCTKCNGF